MGNGSPAQERQLDDLMAQLSEGRREAFDPLFRALQPRALRLASARLGPGLAKDVAQSALLKVFARASEFRAGAPVLPWFYGIVANEITSARRKHAREVQARVSAGEQSDHARTDDTVLASADPETLLLERELAHAMHVAIDELDRPSADAIAALLEETSLPGVTAPAFRKRVSRAYARLRILLRGSHGD